MMMERSHAGVRSMGGNEFSLSLSSQAQMPNEVTQEESGIDTLNLDSGQSEKRSGLTILIKKFQNFTKIQLLPSLCRCYLFQAR